MRLHLAVIGKGGYRLPMPRRAQNFIWRKSVEPGWLERNDGRLQELAPGGFALIERPGKKRVTVEALCENPAAAQEMLQAFGGRSEALPRDWLVRFAKKNARPPLRIGARLLITDARGPANALCIPAGAAFGTGEHATTAMSLRVLERVTRRRAKGWHMLDAGTGSGILALAGKRFGAGGVLAIDHDPLALATAKQNARANGIRGVQFVVGDVRKRLRGRFDIITANLYSELLAFVLPDFRRRLTDDGRLILSGVLRAQEAGLTRALRAAGFHLLETRRRGKWVAILARTAAGKTRLTPARRKSTFLHP